MTPAAPTPPHTLPNTGPAAAASLDGVLLVDKPVGPTSHDIVAAIRRTFRIPKVGHGGTLDPNATGLLVILLGRGTALSSRIMGGDKCYSGVMLFGRTTNSQDIDGEVVEEKPVGDLTAAQIEEQMRQLLGDTYQMPPMVSAIKVEGVPLYKLARKGQTIEREPRLVHVYRFRLLSYEAPRATFEVVCTKGTYVRTLCHDIGQKLGCGACLEALRRTQSGALRVSEALPFDQILRLPREALAQRVIPYYAYLQSAGGGQ